MFAHRRAFAALLVCVVVAMGASPVRAQNVPTIHVAFIAVDDQAEAMYAKDMGFFTKAGINVELQPMSNAGAIAAAIASNAVEIGYLPMIPVAIAHHKSIPLVVIAPGSVFRSVGPITSLFVAPASPIRKASDLNGKTIGVPGLGSIAEFGARTWIEKNGGDLTTIKFTEVPFPTMPGALSAGRIDAAMITEPFLTAAKTTERVLVAKPFSAIAREFAFGAWVTAAPYAKDHEDIVKRFAAAIRETATWANKNQAASAAILQKYTKIDAATVAAMSRAEYTDRITPALMDPVIAIAGKYASFPPFPAAELLYAPPRT